MSERDEFITWVQTMLTGAEEAIHNGDASPRRAIWSRNDPVTVLGARTNATGQAELDDLFAHLAESFSDCTSYELQLLEAEVLDDAAYTVAFEHTSASINGVPTTYTLRATQIYRRERGRAEGRTPTRQRATELTFPAAQPVQKALAAGIPVCVVPFARDQLDVAKLVGLNAAEPW